MTHFITINGTTYRESKKALDAYNAPIAAADIDEAYTNPSYFKRSIWERWAKELTGAIWIKGYISQAFSIAGTTRDEETDKEYAVFITKTYNYAHEI